MSNPSEIKGKCLCGAVSVTAAPEAHEVAACHCRMCRRWSGGPAFSTDCGSKVSFTGDDNISVYASSEWAERGFCKSCGTHLFYRLKESGQHFMPAGLFDDDSNNALTHQIFIDEKPAYYSFANKTEDMTGEQVFAMFGQSD